MTTTARLAAAIEWFAQHEADKRGTAGTAYEVMKRDFDLSFDEATTVCREVRKRVGEYPIKVMLPSSERRERT